ncbi:alpha-1,3-glucanase [Cordyceps fumosorosea ARSEF 2679]|uniref:Alpha-1,3-glucanase n=1 Tax=Cordyceps fumosorosea (strain ARSEF 2679) TaxID=1081104 RepID=A0A167S9Z5_CORFA|nr:alpha-1,3-glucanase [Cordyceps fumosorosea ARSEF 2679]OAA59411.1 alpha-1,3-glucanase [Cordyceps fumosorosea ARSEF 2679]
MIGALRKLAVGALAAAAALSSVASGGPLAERAADRLVFCHFMIGIVGDRTSSNDYDDDMRRAKAAGIDAFALNIGVDGYTDQQLGYAYDSAARNGMRVFISFDFNWWSPGDAGGVGAKIKQYKDRPAQLRVDGRVFASSFAGDGLDVDAMRGAAGENVYFVPNFHPGQSSADKIDGALNWMGWPSDGSNKAPKPGRSVSVADGDSAYQSWLGGKTYLAPVSPWFFTHFGPEVSFSKNWVFPGGSLLFDRWNEILQKGFPMVEIVTWNDYGESHYVGPLNSPHYDDGNSKWTNDMPHDGWLDLSKPFIKAYKAGAKSVDNYIDDEKIIYWYRRTLASLDCDATDTTSGRSANNASGNYFEGRPDGWQTLPDVVYVASFLKSAGIITVTSGGQTHTENAPAGAHIFAVPAAVGRQTFALGRGGATVMQETSLMDIADVCPCGLYNFNAYVGTVPHGPSDPLQGHGLASLTIGLHVSTCEARPSLGTNPPVPGGGSTPPGNPVTSPTATNPPPTSTPPSGGQVCVEGTVADGESGNYTGLCKFSCNYGYCPPGPCKCTRYGSQVNPPPETGTRGCPLQGEGDGYKGLCSYTCNHGYCPDTACRAC